MCFFLHTQYLRYIDTCIYIYIYLYIYYIYILLFIGTPEKGNHQRNARSFGAQEGAMLAWTGSRKETG
jgi:hypothetical protein